MNYSWKNSVAAPDETDRFNRFGSYKLETDSTIKGPGAGNRTTALHTASNSPIKSTSVISIDSTDIILAEVMKHKRHCMRQLIDKERVQITRRSYHAHMFVAQSWTNPRRLLARSWVTPFTHISAQSSELVTPLNTPCSYALPLLSRHNVLSPWVLNLNLWPERTGRGLSLPIQFKFAARKHVGE